MSAVLYFRWLALFLSLKATYRLYHLRCWAEPEDDHQLKSRSLKNKDFLLEVDFPLSSPNLHSCTLLQVSNIFGVDALASSVNGMGNGGINAMML